MRTRVHPLSGATYDVRPDGLLDITEHGITGVFDHEGRWVSGELRHCDPQLLTGGEQVARLVGVRIEARLGLRLSPTLIWQYPTIAALAEYLVEKQLLARVTSDTKSPTMAPPSAPTATAEEYEEGML